MEHYNVFIVTIKELVMSGHFWKIAVTLIAVILTWRLPDLIEAVRWW